MVIVINSSTPSCIQQVLKPATYLFEVWGAQGVSAKYENNNYRGGLGGYSKGTISITSPITIFACVGGSGQFATSDDIIMGGGFNGGGNGRTNDYYIRTTGGGGGGASDIRIGQNSHHHRVIVAGGGGGATGNLNSAGGNGGGENGANGEQFRPSYGTSYGGSQTFGGSPGIDGMSGTFGNGGNATSASDGWIGGGGGGWYGGGSGGDHSAGAGGSGYVLTKERKNLPDGYAVPSKYFLSECSTSAGIRQGNGSVLITRISPLFDHLTKRKHLFMNKFSGLLFISFIHS